MAYADYTFYTERYFGSVVPDSDFPRVAQKASDWLDVLTFDRLADGLPSNERHQERIKRAVCTVAELLYQIELAEKQALASASGTSGSTTGNGVTSGVITSVSSGSESISYASPQQMAAGAKEWSAVYTAAGDAKKINDLLLKTAMPLLMGICTDEGIPLLYAGM